MTVPLHSAEHMYIVTGRIDGVHPDLPVLRDPDGYIYVKEEVGGLLMGGFEPVAKPWAMDGIPENFEFGMLPDDWDQFQILMENALIRLPALETAEIKTFMNGPESFTPDNNFIMGEAPELKNFFVGAGFNSIGIASGGGAGRALAEWIVQGEPTLDLWPVDIRRFARFHDNDRFLKDRVKRSARPALHDAVAEPRTAVGAAAAPLAALRPARRAARAVRLQDGLGAAELLRADARPRRGSTIRWERQNWFPYAAAEHKATREAVTIIDLTSFAKFLLQGRDARSRAAAALRQRCRGAGRHDGLHRPAQRARHLRERSDRRAPCRRPLPAGHRHRAGDARRRLDPPQSADGAHATLTDVTSAYAVIAVMGPRARDLLARLTRAPLDNAAFPFGAIREIGIGARRPCWRRAAPMWASSAGSFTCRPSMPARVYDALMEAGADLGARNAGYYAIESLRLEKGYRAWGRELTPDYNPYEAGLELRGEARQGRLHRPRRAARREGQAAGAAAAELRRDVARHADRAWRRADPARRRAGRRSHLGGLRPHASAASWRSATWRPAARVSTTRGSRRASRSISRASACRCARA